jgi:hypothetical protein
MRQYFIESDTAETPFSRQQRALVYQRSKSVNDTRPFGTLQDVYEPGIRMDQPFACGRFSSNRTTSAS